ncbi:MAG: aminotransferase class IV, partial [Kangiellaceae bacterium]|nr:aminotransferase class IV [Kangiellaceae bacterium]
KICRGVILNLSYHNARFNKAQSELFGVENPVDLEKKINLKGLNFQETYLCRVTYDAEIKKIEFVSYTPKNINTVKLVEANTINYNYKFKDRAAFKSLEKEADADAILIVKNEEITDFSFANVVFFTPNNEAFTPLNPLLKGTTRDRLLAENKIKKRVIKVTDLQMFNRFKPINAMLDFEKTPFIAIENIF